MAVPFQRAMVVGAPEYRRGDVLTIDYDVDRKGHVWSCQRGPTVLSGFQPDSKESD